MNILLSPIKNILHRTMEDGDILLILGLIGLGILALFKLKPPETAISKAVAVIPKSVISNEETWKWVDYKGRQRSISIHRDVKVHG